MACLFTLHDLHNWPGKVLLLLSDNDRSSYPQNYTPGTYDIYVGHAVGEFKKWIATTKVVVELK